MAEVTRRAEYLVIRRDAVAAALPPEHHDEAAALGAAMLKTRSDGEPRVIVQLIAEVRPDPEPAVVVTRFREKDGTYAYAGELVDLPVKGVAA